MCTFLLTTFLYFMPFSQKTEANFRLNLFTCTMTICYRWSNCVFHEYELNRSLKWGRWPRSQAETGLALDKLMETFIDNNLDRETNSSHICRVEAAGLPEVGTRSVQGRPLVYSINAYKIPFFVHKSVEIDSSKQPFNSFLAYYPSIITVGLPSSWSWPLKQVFVNVYSTF